MKSDNKWHSGPPPSVGWWPASAWKEHGAYRWWDGKDWSLICTAKSTLADVEKRSKINTGFSMIFWKHRPKSWPKRSFT